MQSHFMIEFEQEEDGRWIAEIPAIPGALCYGASKEEAKRHVEALTLRLLADRIETEKQIPELANSLFAFA